MACKLASLAVALCLLATVLAAPQKIAVNADENDVAVAKSVVDARAGADSSVIEPLPPSSGHPGRKPNNFYNDIFNIPTSILNAVSRLLTGGGSAGGSAAGGHVGASAGAGVGAGGAGAHVSLRSGVPEAGATLGNAHVDAGAKPGTPNGFISDIFNIPISALNAVNQLLNNNQKNAGK